MILNAQNLKKQYNPPDGAIAVKGVSFHIDKGEIFSLLGPNGAGKTTTISMLSGLLVPTSGDAQIDGHSITQNPQQVKQVIGVVPQEIALYEDISARENLLFWGRMYGLGGEALKERVTAVLHIADLTDRANDAVKTYSGGMKRRINIAVALLHQPKLLFMDEPTVGIDPQSRRRILDTVKQLQADGLTVVYTTHYMEEAQELSNRIGIIDHGEMIAVGSQEELTKQVGQYDTMQITLAPDHTATQDLAPAFAHLSAIHQVHQEEDMLTLQCVEANVVLSQVMEVLGANGRSISQLNIQEPNLEAVFLHLTGRALRD